MSNEELKQRLADQQDTVNVLLELNGQLSTRLLAKRLNEAGDTLIKHGGRIGALETTIKALSDRLEKASRFAIEQNRRATAAEARLAEIERKLGITDAVSE